MPGPKDGYKKQSPQTAAAKNLGKKLRRARQYNFLSGREVSEKLGVDRSFVIRIESGDRVPDLVELNALAKAVKLDIKDLLAQLIADLSKPAALGG